ncbi:phospholipase D family protein [Paraburkholderia sp. BL27I4N3]|uniref:phospholipase D family protein n=1 Tax=Paraburkholderia sp. BL27I4N3 TaxID=1938805 RepID=UPI000E27F48E|nr:phospholipase D family protein [Paraburkholderia sp. BL27I4N3]
MPLPRHFAPGFFQRSLIVVSLNVVCAAALCGCALPPLESRTPSTAISNAEAQATTLGRSTAHELAAHHDLAGIHPLADPRAAFAARMELIRTAERTLDVQYYIWRSDLTGTLLLDALRAAADRGVRVRLLLDDYGISSSLDGTLAALQTHPNIEVRLFNPFVIRKPKFIGFLTDFSRVNRRMHNKSFTADGAVTIVGGRNIGDEYFGATDGIVFADLDVLAVGPISADVANEFDRYWASGSSYPVDLIVHRAASDKPDELDRKVRAVESDSTAAAYLDALRDAPIVQQLLDGTLPLEWARTQMVSDDPAKALSQAPSETSVVHQFREILGDPMHELDLVSPYFVPGVAGTAYFTGLARRGVAVRVLTNSLEATDVTAVHSGYMTRRVELIESGVELYELRRLPGVEHKSEEHAGIFGSSGSSLHAKTFVVDSSRVFVGSFNFDQRSAHLNTELGFVIDSAPLASRIASIFVSLVPQVAYLTRLDADGRLYWLKRENGMEVRYDTEPNTTWLRRLGVWFLSILPIESLL